MEGWPKSTRQTQQGGHMVGTWRTQSISRPAFFTKRKPHRQPFGGRRPFVVKIFTFFTTHVISRIFLPHLTHVCPLFSLRRCDLCICCVANSNTKLEKKKRQKFLIASSGPRGPLSATSQHVANNLLRFCVMERVQT